MLWFHICLRDLQWRIVNILDDFYPPSIPGALLCLNWMSYAFKFEYQSQPLTTDNTPSLFTCKHSFNNKLPQSLRDVWILSLMMSKQCLNYQQNDHSGFGCMRALNWKLLNYFILTLFLFFTIKNCLRRKLPFAIQCWNMFSSVYN